MNKSQQMIDELNEAKRTGDWGLTAPSKTGEQKPRKGSQHATGMLDIESLQLVTDPVRQAELIKKSQMYSSDPVEQDTFLNQLLWGGPGPKTSMTKAIAGKRALDFRRAEKAIPVGNLQDLQNVIDALNKTPGKGFKVTVDMLRDPTATQFEIEDMVQAIFKLAGGKFGKDTADLMLTYWIVKHKTEDLVNYKLPRYDDVIKIWDGMVENKLEPTSTFAFLVRSGIPNAKNIWYKIFKYLIENYEKLSGEPIPNFGKRRVSSKG